MIKNYDLLPVQSLFEFSKNPLSLMDENGKLLLVNLPFAELLHRSRVELEGAQFADLIHPDDAQVELIKMEQMLKGVGKDSVSEKRLKTQSGEWLVIRQKSRRMALGEKQFGLLSSYDTKDGVVTTFGSGQKSPQDEMFQMIFDYFPVGIILLDSERKFLRANRAYQQMLGYSEQELQGMTVFDVTHPEDIPATQHASEDLRSKGHILRRLNKRKIKKNGEVIWVQVTSSSVPFAQGQHLLSVIEDLSEKVRVEQELFEQRSRVAEAAKMASLAEMAGAVSHEINNPLSVIGARAERIIRMTKGAKAEPQEVIDDAGRILKTVERIAKIVQGLKSFSRSAEGDPFETVSINKVIDEAAQFCQERLKAKSFSFEIMSDSDYLVKCRPTQISQVILNLINNSIDALESESERWIEIRVSSEQNIVIIRMTDSGHGIPESVAKKLMEPFFTTKGVGKGTGLGLSISKGIIEEHGGTFVLDQSHLRTSFVMTLPLIQG